jgi:hypothetical protein
MRTVLYANRQLSDYLRDSYVLLWTSERPVPKVTIDFGDGRTMERTVTGNAVHYVLDGQGRPLDAIPGLYAPLEFTLLVARSHQLHRELAGKPGVERAALLQVYHRSRVADLEREFNGRARNASYGARGSVELLNNDGTSASDNPFPDATKGEVRFSTSEAEFIRRVGGASAVDAVIITTSKSGIELPLVTTLTRYDRAVLENATTEAMWRHIAFNYTEATALDARTLVLMSRELPEYAKKVLTPAEIERVTAAVNPFAAEKAVRLAMSKFRGGEGPLVSALSATDQNLAAMASQFMETLAGDTVRNEFTLHTRIHQWFADGEVDGELEPLNERVYREIFLTPRSDPWLGLMPGAYSGINGGGARTGP